MSREECLRMRLKSKHILSCPWLPRDLEQCARGPVNLDNRLGVLGPRVCLETCQQPTPVGSTPTHHFERTHKIRDQAWALLASH